MLFQLKYIIVFSEYSFSMVLTVVDEKGRIIYIMHSTCRKTNSND